jgi:teichuronic acid biosynthesis glycosyltransferase TuaC
VRLLYFTTAYNVDHLDRVHEEFLEQWVALGHQVTILVPDTRRDRTERWTHEDATVPVVRVAVSATWFDRAANWISHRVFHYDYFLTVLRAYREFLSQHREYDMVHAESIYPIGAIAALVSFFDRRIFVPTIRGADLMANDDIGYGYARFPLTRALIRLTFARSRAVRAVTPGAGKMARAFGCPPDKIVTIPRNILASFYHDNPEGFRDEQRRWLEKEHPEIRSKQVIVSAGRLLPIKGFDDLVRAMSALPDTIVLICGANRQDERLGDYAAYLKRLIAERGVADRVKLVGAVPGDQIARYFAAGDVLAVSSIIEGGNRTLLEAASLGTPFVATDTAGTPDLFTSAEGLVVPPRRPDLLADALARILAESPEARVQRREACVVSARRFKALDVARTLADTYTRLLDGLSTTDDRPPKTNKA